jgi:hypothetical protein
MNAVAGTLLAFLVSGGYLLVWPIYRLSHPRKSQRRRALFRLFLIELCLYVPITGFVIFGFFRILDFHHVFFVIEILYLLLALFLWVATYGVWADGSPESDS